ncbi:uncharacterized protein LOC129284922 [Prosopis cineraria]|uniref:uncharacterized protein LOC129284922 n=1 Tax=Prosopis cineraria TaxID=364024 RepID=UPI002410493C|nr:uncharacterized protein LOC129284922 [Prosopis cineraria]
MAAIETNTKNSMHIRSNSLPSTSHPLVSQFEEHLNRLKPSEVASSSSLSHKLNGLQNLYDSTLKLLQLSATQKEVAREFSEKSIDKLLEGFLFLLDTSSTVKDCLQQLKESIQALESVIRRKRGAETSELTIEVGNYLASRKKMKQEIKKALRNLKGISKDSSTNNDKDTLPMLSILKEAEAISVSSLETLLIFICDPKGQLKQRRWSVISKLMQPKRVACDSEESDTNEFEKVDVALQSLVSHKISSMENFQTHLENLETCIQDLQAGVESLSRNLIRIRVSLLNFFNH